MKKPTKFLFLILLLFFIGGCENAEDTGLDSQLTAASKAYTQSEGLEFEKDFQDLEAVLILTETSAPLALETMEGLYEYEDELNDLEGATYYIIRPSRPRPRPCPRVVGCIPKDPYYFVVPAISDKVWAEVYIENELVASTNEEFGGSIYFDEEKSLAYLNFGIPTQELVLEGATIVGASLVIVEDQIQEASFKGTF